LPSPPLILFDLGGVLVRICRTWEEACAHADIEIRGPARFRDPALAARRKHFHHLHQTGQIACKAYFAAISESTGGLYTADEVRRVHNAWTLDDYPGVSDLIRRIRQVGLRTACLSNTNQSHWTILLRGDGPRRERSAAVTSLHTHLASHLMGLAKPDEAIYILAEESLGVAPGSIIFFDDLAENIAAARARGWQAHQIDHTADTAAQIEKHLKATGIL
jgi:putative hydrolase of the HAD superfamily